MHKSINKSLPTYPLAILVIFLGHNFYYSCAMDLYTGSNILVDFKDYPLTFPSNLSYFSLTPNRNKTVNLKELRLLDSKYAACGKIKDIRERTIREFHHYFETKQLSIFQLCACYIQRIRKMNPYLNAVIEINPDALKQALKLDYQRYLGDGRIHGTLYGIPILLKDNIATADSMQTCSGSLALVGCKPHRDAAIVTQIKKHKGIILGKSNLSEFGNFRDDKCPKGWSGRGGQTHNCYSWSKDPGSSSSGSAVATSANLCAFSIGTETDASIVTPAEKANIVGLKTSRNYIPIDGIIPISADSQDVAGPITRTVEDAAIFMKIFETYGCEANSQDMQDHHHDASSRKFRIGILREYFWESKNETQIKKISVLNQTLITFGNSDRITLVDPVTASAGSREEVSLDKEITVSINEFKDGFNKYLKTCSFGNDHENEHNNNNSHLEESKHWTLKDVIGFNKNNPVPEGYGQSWLLKAEAVDGVNNITYLNARNENIKAAKDFINSIFRNYNLDAIASPIDEVENSTSLYGFFAVTGYPYITVPAGFINTYDPVGIVFHGLMCSEKTLLEIAKIYEADTRARQPPFFAS